MNNLFTPREIAAFHDDGGLFSSIVDSHHGRLRGSLRAEMLEEVTTRACRPFEGGFCVPFALMARDLTTGGSGAALIGTETPPALDLLRPYNAALQAGARLMQFESNATIPRATATATPVWLSTEAFSDVTESQATLGVVNMSPKTCSILTEISEQMRRQSNVSSFVTRELLRTLGGALDQAIFSGTGSNGQPLGLMNTNGVGAVPGAAFDWDDACAMLLAVGENDVEGDTVRWFGAPDVRRLLSNRERMTGSARPIWDDRSIGGYDAICSRVVPNGALVVGAMQQLIIAMFGDYISIQTGHPPGSFNRGLIAYRAWMSVDVSVTEPAAFARATSIT